jgi:class 3 adenylate cyclase
MDALSAYIPIDRRAALASGAALPDRAFGCVLFADISGFTPVTAALAQALGPQRGAEELSRHLNEVFDVLTAAVQRYGGSVVSFAGDAMICWFDDAAPGAAAAGLRFTATARAATCAYELQRLMGRAGALRLPGGASSALGLKVALAAGDCRRFLVGDSAVQRIDLLAGGLLDQMAAAEQQARRGEIVLTAAAAAQLKELIAVAEWRPDGLGGRVAVLAGLAQDSAPAPWPEQPALPAEVARPWLLAPVYERLQRGEGEFLAELRPVVVLFLKFGGIDYDHGERAGAQLDAYVAWAQRQLARYEGNLLQITVGDKGSYFSCTFGAPQSHEDDAERAVAVALRLQAPPPELDFVCDIQIGISQGVMRAGAYGGQLRRTYGVLGTEANIAARLMSLARPGQIVASARVAELAGAGYSFVSLGEQRLKGHAEPLPVFALGGKRRGPREDGRKGHAAAMVGRRAEREAVAGQLAALRGGAGGCLVIEGEAGIGKSRLVRELLAQARGIGVEALVGAGLAVESGTPYFAWRPVLQQLFGLDRPADELDAEGRQRWRQLVLGQIEAEHPELLRAAPLLNAALPLDIPENDLTSQLSGHLRADNTDELVAALLAGRVRRGPLALVIEDAHWLDSASWRLIAMVRREVQTLLLVLVSRPRDDSAPIEYGELLAAPATRRLRLQSLPASEIEALVAQRLGVAALPAPLTEFILEKTDGHPFFSEELAYALREAGLIHVREGRCELGVGGLQGVDFPDTIQGVIASRIDRLPASEQLTLKVASVIGRLFLFRALHDIHPVPGDRGHLHDYLDTLGRLDITRLEEESPERLYIFKHVITQDVAYNMLLFAQRWQLHRHVAEWYERSYAADLSPYYPFLAHHYFQAAEGNQGDPGLTLRAIDYLERAGRQALQSYANREAVRFFRDALALDERMRGAAAARDGDPTASPEQRAAQSRRARWECQLGEAYQNLGHLPESRAHLERALALLGYPMPARRGDWARGLGRQGLRLLGARLRPAARPLSAQEQEHNVEVARVFLLLLPLYYVLNDSARILYALLHTEHLAAPAGPSPVLAEIYASMTVAYGMVPVHRLAERYGGLAQETARRLNHMPTIAFVNHRVSIYWSSIGRYELVRQLLGEGMTISAQIGDWTRWRECAYAMRRAMIDKGEFGYCHELAVRLYESAQRSGHFQHQIWGLAQQAASLCYSGDLDGTIAKAEAALSMIATAQIGDTTPMVFAYSALIQAHLERGDLAAAEQVVQAAERIFPRAGRPHSLYGELYRAVTDVYLRRWEAAPRSAGLQRAVEKLCNRMDQFARIYPVTRSGALLYRGRYAWQRGQRERALRYCEQALVLAERFANLYDRGLIHYELGRHLPHGSPARAEHLGRAEQIFAEIATPHNLARVRNELASS